MFPAFIFLLSIYLFCALIFRFFMANAPEAFEDEFGFHYANAEDEEEIFVPGEASTNA